MPETKEVKNNLVILSIVAVVGIVAIVGIFGIVRKSYEKPSDLVGEAPKYLSTHISGGAGSVGSGDHIRDVPGWPNRPYDLHIPPGYDSSKPIPVVLAIHGGGGNDRHMAEITCPNGDLNNSKCLSKLADREGFVVVYPNGDPNPLIEHLRTWNAGGGKNGFSCVSGAACKNNIDDISYFKALLDDVEKVVNVDAKRVYATGISNGAAMSHRLACELSDRIAAIAPVAGGNQFSTVATCAPSRPMPVLEIHGTADPAWLYEGGENKKSLWNFIGATPGIFFSIPQTVSDWALRNGCKSTPITKNLTNITNDSTTVTAIVYSRAYSGCKSNGNVVLLRINNGGHTWPQGWQYFSEDRVGKVSQQFNANEVIWEFFKHHPLRQQTPQNPENPSENPFPSDGGIIVYVQSG